MKARSLVRDLIVALAAVCVASLFIVSYVAKTADASHEPANKAGAAGSDIDEVTDGTVLLSETMRVSSPEDAIISVTAECSILTQVVTNNEQLDSTAFGSVRLWVEVDGNRVPVAVNDTAEDGDDEVNDEGDASDIGEVTFCNRAHEKSVADEEDPLDGVDYERDYLRTRSANAFNWLALDLGTAYDAGNDNIITVQLLADYDTAISHDTNLAEAFVGSRTMIIEPTKVSNHETVQDLGGAGS